MLLYVMIKRKKSSKKNKHYFQKFFDGELSLPHSYWLVGIVYSFGVGIILAIFMLGKICQRELQMYFTLVGFCYNRYLEVNKL